MMAKAKQLHATSLGTSERIAAAILEILGHVPKSKSGKSSTPLVAARAKAKVAAAKAGIAAGTLSLPPGPIGMLTILPEMMGVWKIQSQLVADIARIYGKSSVLTQERMLYCLFRHSAAQAVRDLAIRAGERVLVRKASVRLIQSVAQKIGIRLSQRSIASAISRWVPIIGAIGVGTYASYDTFQVGKTAIELFGSMSRRAAPNNSFKPKPLRGSA